jgi:membrane-bound serine protease (ClpP class)
MAVGVGGAAIVRAAIAVAVACTVGLAAALVVPATSAASATPASQAASAAPEGGGAVVYVATLDGIIHPISAEFIDDAIDTADTHQAAALVFVLETPGGLLESTRTIISRLTSCRTPVVVYVGPGAARAASAGFLITLAADVAAMAPAAHIGAAHPVSGGGEKMDETTEKKAAADVAAYARSLAQARHRNVKLADAAVLESRAFTADEAIKADPPLIDLIATDVADLLKQLDGRTIRRFDGRETTLHTTNARTEPLEMTARQRFLSAIAHPQIAYILFTLGLLGLTVELWNPGAILPGVAGGLCLLLAFLAFQVIPINTAGLLLIAFGLLLLVLELKVPSFGVLGVGGATSLVLGSIVMMNRTADVRVSLEFIVPAMLAFAGIFLFLGRLALTSQRRPAVTGANAMIGEHGRALTPIPAASAVDGNLGRIAAHGEIWNARSRGADPIAADAPVRIVAVDGLTVTVERADVPSAAPARSTPGGSPS